MENNEETENVKEVKVIIIGAGIAGLSAANHLVKNGFTDFLILEGRNRIGGRICGIPIGSQKVELGANWIHGVLGNPIFEFAMSHGLIDIVNIPKPHKIVAATEKGTQASFSILQEIYEAYICFLRRCEEYFLCQYLPPEGIHSVGDHIALEVELYLNKIDNSNDRHIRRLIFECLLKRETCITGCDSMTEIDLLELGSYTELQGGNIVLPSGYSSILDPMAKHIPADKILKRYPVSNIKWASAGDSGFSDDTGEDSDDSDKTVIEEGILVSSSDKREENDNHSRSSSKSKNGFSKVEITCENGKKFQCDHVICTIPLGVLKDKVDTLFTPSLPTYKVEAIERLLFGTVDKIFLEYDRPFLSANISEVMLLWEPDDDETTDISNNWYKKIYSFSKISETLLLGWISGKEAIYMESLPYDVIADKCTEILRKFLNDPLIPKPNKCVCTTWYSQPFTRGSYTAMAVGASQLDIEQLAQPLYSSIHQQKPSVLFAGEHTHSNFYSTVHGAYLTGRTAAQIVLTPELPNEVVLDCEDTSDLSSWIQGISLDN
ncbi:spermine oxidase isoform X1 [Chrysoperla carnea]|uniref:spermine oxidase isoform X1 n=1 Tax=Chrysoperla carnea TaxID=189513 RepID=UPI001D07C338|nr:spermine oxidase isoform X1 [Chrysoperla carnea]